MTSKAQILAIIDECSFSSTATVLAKSYLYLGIELSSTVRSSSLNSLCYCLCLYCGFWLWALKNSGSRKFIPVTKEIRLVHLRVLLTSLNICSGRTTKLQNMIRIINYIVLNETGKNWVVPTKIFSIVILN